MTINDHGTAQRIAEQVATRLVSPCLQSIDSQVIDFIANVMMIRRTQVTPVIPSQQLCLQSNDRLRYQATLLFDVTDLEEIVDVQGTLKAAFIAFISPTGSHPN